MSSNNITIKDIAKKAGVSYSTVSRVLSDNKHISSKTKSHVMKICDELGYTPNYVARALVEKHSNLIGLILPSLRNPFMAELAHDIEEVAHASGYNIILCNSVENLEREQEVFRLMMGRQVDGMIVFPVSSESGNALSQLMSAQVPTIFLNDYSDENSEYGCISTDNFKGGYMGVEYLHSIGHTEILYFSTKPTRFSNKERLKGYISACVDLGLTPHLFYLINQNKSYNILMDDNGALGYEMAGDFFKSGQYKDYTAIFCSTDMTAIGIIKAAAEYNLYIPDDISLLGYDNISYAALPKIDLSTIKQPIKEMAELGVKNIINSIEHKGETSGKQVLRMLDPELVIRNTCKTINRD